MPMIAGCSPEDANAVLLSIAALKAVMTMRDRITRALFGMPNPS